MVTSSAAQGCGGSFKNRKPIGEVGCCESGMAERSHWWTERCLRSPLFVSLSLVFSLFLYLSLIIYLSTYWSICLPIYLSVCLSIVAVQRITDAEAPSCCQKRQTRWRVPSEKTDTLLCNEFPMLIRHHAVRKDKHVGVQRITDAAAPSRRQKRQTRKSRTESDIPRAADKIWSNNVPLLFDASSVLVSADSSKRRDVLPRKMLPRAFSTVHRHNQASDATATAK